MQKIVDLNMFISTQIKSLLEFTKINIEQIIEFLQKQQDPYLNNSSVLMLNVLSKNTVESFNKILIDSEIGYVEKNYIILTKYFEFDSLVFGVKKIPYSLLFIEKFISIKSEDDKNILVPSQYEIGEITADVIKNLEEIISSLDVNINLYTKI